MAGRIPHSAPNNSCFLAIDKPLVDNLVPDELRNYFLTTLTRRYHAAATLFISQNKTTGFKPAIRWRKMNLTFAAGPY